jgi:hypothetical protein
MDIKGVNFVSAKEEYPAPSNALFQVTREKK